MSIYMACNVTVDMHKIIVNLTWGSYISLIFFPIWLRFSSLFLSSAFHFSSFFFLDDGSKNLIEPTDFFAPQGFVSASTADSSGTAAAAVAADVVADGGDGGVDDVLRLRHFPFVQFFPESIFRILLDVFVVASSTKEIRLSHSTLSFKSILFISKFGLVLPRHILIL